MIMRLIISNEADIERAVKDILELAKLPDKKKVELNFPSFLISDVFDSFLLEALVDNEFENVNIDAHRIVRS